jgi:hypothetical protein
VIGPHQLQVGVHMMTLMLKDDHGIADTDTFPVTVQDTQLASLSIPTDLVWFVEPGVKLPYHVDIGQASGSDACSPDVMITNDAPEGFLFPAGETLVTWTADDGRSNITTKVQKVTVIPLEDKEDLLSKIKSGSLQLKSAIDKSAATIVECQEAPHCAIDFQPIIKAIGQLANLVSDMSLPVGNESLQSQATGKLTAGVTALQQAEQALKSSNAATGAARAELRTTAKGQLQTASTVMSAIVDLPWPPPGRSRCFIATAAYGSPLASHVVVLRDFRDRYLLANSFGRRFVAFYDRYSPPLAHFIGRRESLRTTVRVLLTPLVYVLMYPFWAGMFLLCLAGCAYAGVRR